MGCNCGKKIAGYVVKRPGESDRQVSTETAAQELVRGIVGATYTAVAR